MEDLGYSIGRGCKKCTIGPSSIEQLRSSDEPRPRQGRVALGSIDSGCRLAVLVRRAKVERRPQRTVELGRLEVPDAAVKQNRSHAQADEDC